MCVFLQPRLLKSIVLSGIMSFDDYVEGFLSASLRVCWLYGLLNV